MIKEALQYIVGLGKAEEHMINGACYSDKPLHRNAYADKSRGLYQVRSG